MAYASSTKMVPVNVPEAKERRRGQAGLLQRGWRQTLGLAASHQAGSVQSDATVKKSRRRTAGAGRACVVACTALFAAVAISTRPDRRHPAPAQDLNVDDEVDSATDLVTLPMSQVSGGAPAFLALDEQDGRFCGKEGDLCKCFGHVRYGRMFTWSDDLIVDGSVNCSAAHFGDPVPMGIKICKCYPTLCTTDVGICTPEPCSCPGSRDPTMEWSKTTLMTGDGVKCWACQKRASSAGVLVDDNSPFCPTQMGRCSKKRSCKCESSADTKRVMQTKEGEKCWTCSVAGEGSALHMDQGQKAMFWMLPLLWPWMDFPNSAYEVYKGCPVLTNFCALCVVGFIFQNFVPFLKLNQYFSFYAPCMKKAELWRLFTYFMLHSDLQHLASNLFHLLDALDLEGVPPGMEVSPGVALRCTRDGPVGSVCYPDVGVGRHHLICIFAVVLAYGALVGTIKSFGALVQGASSVCYGVDGALIALYAMFLGAGLDSQLKIPEFGAFFWMRIGIIAFHITIDIMQGVCAQGKDTVGTIAHMASLVAGFCYVILFLPPMGDGSLFDSQQPYIIDCGLTSPQYVTLAQAQTQCIAFFNRANGMELGTAKNVAIAVLGGGVLASMVNAFLNRHISDDGIACCSCGDATPEGNRALQNAAAPEVEVDRAREIEELNGTIKAMKEGVEHLKKLWENMPDPAGFAVPAAAPQGGPATA
mmetsp:Transcript_9216/g.20454  ORF Transcript_9216/g.20454 Transcript_9216/m.20454 type:complete len:701 (+) Transcript_9216:36-2138(+)